MDTKIKEEEDKKKGKQTPECTALIAPTVDPVKRTSKVSPPRAKIGKEQHFACELIREASRSGAVDTLMKWNLNY